MTRLNSRASVTCPEFFHKEYAPTSFPGLTKDPEGEVAKEFKEQGIKYEAKVLETLKVLHPGVVIIDRNLTREESQFDTARALINPQIRLIYGADIGQLTEEELARSLGTPILNVNRVSRPDLMVNVGTRSAGIPMWAPVDIKSHGAIDENKSNSIFLSTTADLDPSNAASKQGKLKSDDLHQLAHYIRHLQALGLASPELWAGIIGREIDQCVFMKMADVVTGLGRSQQDFLSVHDADFAVALDVVERARIENENHNQSCGVIPQQINDMKKGCPGCVYKSACLQEMKDFDGGTGHVTLLASITPDVAATKLPGIHSIGQLRAAPATDDYMMTAKLRAEVWKSKVPQLLNPAEPFDLPEFDIEIDIDLENSMEALRELAPDEELGDDRLYLYGFGVHDRTKNKDWKSAVIETISDYSNTDEGESAVMLAMWNRLQEEITKAKVSGKSIGIFHYSPHERTWWRNFHKRNAGKPGVPSEAEIEDFIANYLVDLIVHAKKITFPTMGYSIKALAPEAGFKWNVKDPGGAGSLLKYRDAIDQSLSDLERQEAMDWLDSYNRDDVRATFAVREYIRQLKL